MNDSQKTENRVERGGSRLTADDLMRLVNRYTEACDDLGAGLFNQTEAETKAKHAKAKELHGQILAEVYRLHADGSKSERRAIAFGDVVNSQVVAMRAAVALLRVGAPAHLTRPSGAAAGSSPALNIALRPRLAARRARRRRHRRRRLVTHV